MGRGKVMLGLALGNKPGQDDEKDLADLNTEEDTITNKENIATTSTSCASIFNVSNGEELFYFKRTLRNRNRTQLNYFEENDEDKDFSGETISSEYKPTESSLASTETFNATLHLSECDLPEGRSLETETCKSMKSLITPSVLGFETNASGSCTKRQYPKKTDQGKKRERNPTKWTHSDAVDDNNISTDSDE